MISPQAREKANPSLAKAREEKANPSLAKARAKEARVVPNPEMMIRLV